MKRDKKILIVDDVEMNRAILAQLFDSEFEIEEAADGEEALAKILTAPGEIAVVLLDLVMPRMDGYQMMEELRKRQILQRVPVILITGEQSVTSEFKAFELGASDIIKKPIVPFIVKKRVQNIVELYQNKNHLEDVVKLQTRQLTESNAIMIDALSTVIEYRNLESGQHIRRIRLFTKLFLESIVNVYPEYHLTPERIEEISNASAMHDIGKIAIPDSILLKPGKLTAEEFEVMKTHTVRGCEILKTLARVENKEYLKYCYNICRYHHERWDGNGYPDGLIGNNIPLCAQVVSLADVYDALTNDRVYKPAYTHEQAVQMILNGECGAFSPTLLECFKNVKEGFLQLATDYADGKVSPEGTQVEAYDEREFSRYDAGELSNLKYFTALQYINATVMEIDLDTGIYHLVFNPNRDFDRFTESGNFRENCENFIRTQVHPGDREPLLNCVFSQLEESIRRGEDHISHTYRKYDSASKGYKLYNTTVQRIRTDNPQIHKVLIFFSPVP